MPNNDRLTDAAPIHTWFSLSYAQYLTIPRSVLQSMPTEWQERFVACLEELDDMIDWRPSEGRYWVQLKDARGRYMADPLMDYARGRRRVEPRAWDETRCQICGWPLNATIEEGCTADSCSMRPPPAQRADGQPWPDAAARQVARQAAGE